MNSKDIVVKYSLPFGLILTAAAIKKNLNDPKNQPI
jgi:hypothetical protein